MPRRKASRDFLGKSEQTPLYVKILGDLADSIRKSFSLQERRTYLFRASLSIFSDRCQPGAAGIRRRPSAIPQFQIADQSVRIGGIQIQPLGSFGYAAASFIGSLSAQAMVDRFLLRRGRHRRRAAGFRWMGARERSDSIRECKISGGEPSKRESLFGWRSDLCFGLRESPAGPAWSADPGLPSSRGGVGPTGLRRVVGGSGSGVYTPGCAIPPCGRVPDQLKMCRRGWLRAGAGTLPATPLEIPGTCVKALVQPL